MGRKGYLLAAIAVVVVAVGAVVFAARTDPGSVGGGAANGDGSAAPALAPSGWLNTSPLGEDDLAGKVVMYDFWTYSCVNCVRTIPYIEAWHNRYAGDGLVIIGVHSPEFEFEKDPGNVADAVQRLGVTYPVALDDEMTIWRAFDNRYWPAHYIYDRDDRQAEVHIGEGGYEATEDRLRDLLGIDPDSPRATIGELRGGSWSSSVETPETYLGSRRAGPSYGSPEPLANGGGTFTTPTSLEHDRFALDGVWTVAPEYVEAGSNASAITLRYTAGEVNLVMASADGQPIDVTVRIDDRPPTTVTVTEPDMYSLVDDDTVADRTITLTPARPGLRAYAFTFGL